MQRYLVPIVLWFTGVTLTETQGYEIGEIMVKSAQYGASAPWNGSDDNGGQAVIQIPRGWVVVGRPRDERRSKYGKASMNVAWIAAEGWYVSDAEVRSRFRQFYDSHGGYMQYQAKQMVDYETNRWLSARTEIRASHSTIRIHARARGNNNPFDQKGASIQGEAPGII